MKKSALLIFSFSNLSYLANTLPVFTRKKAPEKILKLAVSTINKQTLTLPGHLSESKKLNLASSNVFRVSVEKKNMNPLIAEFNRALTF